MTKLVNRFTGLLSHEATSAWCLLLGTPAAFLGLGYVAGTNYADSHVFSWGTPIAVVLVALAAIASAFQVNLSDLGIVAAVAGILGFASKDLPDYPGLHADWAFWLVGFGSVLFIIAAKQEKLAERSSAFRRAQLVVGTIIIMNAIALFAVYGFWHDFSNVPLWLMTVGPTVLFIVWLTAVQDAKPAGRNPNFR